MADPKPRTILVIDDERHVCDLIRLIFESRGWRCIVAHDGREGWEIARTRVPDCILLDIMMPGMNGYEVTIQLRANEATRPIPVLVLTALGNEVKRTEDEWKRSLDVQGLLPKPFTADELLARVEALFAAPATPA